MQERTVRDYVREHLRQNIALLRRTGIPLPDVAAQCGFSDQSHMNRVFAKRLGITPGQYRLSP